MKKLFFIAAMLLIAFTTTAQNKYREAAKKAATATNNSKKNQAFEKQLQKENKALTSIYDNFGNSSDIIYTNDPAIPKLLDEFYDGARYYKVDYKAGLKRLQRVIVVPEDPYFLAAVVDNGTEIRINENLLQFPKLFRVIFLRSMGKLYGLKDSKRYGHAIMGTHWEIDIQHESFAIQTGKGPHQREKFFKALHEKHPLEKRL